MTPSEIDLTPGDEGDEGPALVRPYALVRGRTRAGSAAVIPVEAVIATVHPAALRQLELERAAIADLCERPHGIAELSARLRLPLGVIRVLVGDLAAEGQVVVNMPLDPGVDVTLDRILLERVLAGLEAL